MKSIILFANATQSTVRQQQLDPLPFNIFLQAWQEKKTISNIKRRAIILLQIFSVLFAIAVAVWKFGQWSPNGSSELFEIDIQPWTLPNAKIQQDALNIMVNNQRLLSSLNLNQTGNLVVQQDHVLKLYRCILLECMTDFMFADMNI